MTRHQTISSAIDLYRRLLPLSQKLQKSFTNECNYGVTIRREHEQEKLEKEARKIAAIYGMGIYVQGDPRGCALYLIPKRMSAKDADMHYSTKGIAIY